MRVKDFEIGFSIVDLILGLNGIKKCFELHKSTALLLDVDHLADLPEVAKDVINAVVIEILR